MGGKPILAIAILGWPLDKLPPDLAQKVIEGSRTICAEAGIPLAGGHSIDTAEPIFGLAVSGLVNVDHLKRNDTAHENDVLLLTKPLGVGILTTAEKKGLLKPGDEKLAAKQMMQLNKVGEALGKLPSVSAITDVTGFGLLGHLVEMAEGSGLSATIDFKNIPLINDDLHYYIEKKCVPGGTERNWASYGDKISELDAYQKSILADPQTSGGLLLAVDPATLNEVQQVLKDHHLELFIQPIGRLTAASQKVITVQ